MEERRYEFPPTAEGLALLVKELRKPYGCPWDRKQTLESLRSSMAGECAEVIEAVDLNDRENLCEELGDLLMNVVFMAVIAEEENSFNWEDVCCNVVEKMVRRHEHVLAPSMPKMWMMYSISGRLPRLRKNRRLRHPSQYTAKK